MTTSFDDRNDGGYSWSSLFTSDVFGGPSKIVSATFPKTCIASTAIGLHPKPGGPDAHVVLAMANDPILQSTPQENTSASVELGALNNNQGDQEYALPGKYRRDAIHCRCDPL